MRARARRLLAFGRITIAHRLVRVLLVEQLYRGFSILRGEPFVRIMGWVDVSHAAFLQRRESYLIYK